MPPEFPSENSLQPYNPYMRETYFTDQLNRQPVYGQYVKKVKKMGSLYLPLVCPTNAVEVPNQNGTTTLWRLSLYTPVEKNSNYKDFKPCILSSNPNVFPRTR